MDNNNNNNNNNTNLQNLPLEVLFTIFEFLSPLPRATVSRSLNVSRETPELHPFLALSIVSRTLRLALISFLRGLILHNHIIPFKRLRTVLADNTRDISQYAPVILREWLRATMRNCFACGKHAHRRAIMDSTMVCCTRCDQVHWPNKITMTDAIKKYDLKKLELFGGLLPTNLGGPPREWESLTKDGLIPQRRGLPYGQKFVCGMLTTMFMEEDVRELARKKHQLVDVDEYIQSKSDRYAVRQARINENRERRLDYIRRLTHANGLTVDVTVERYRYFAFRYDFKGLHHRRPKQTFLNLLQGDMILKKLGITFTLSHHGTERWEYNCPLDGSSSRCCSLIRSLIQNKFIMCKTFILGINECHFKRTVTQTQSPTVTNFSRMVGIEQLIYYRTDTPPLGPRSQLCKMEEWADPIDFCLFEAFIEEFGVEGVPRPTYSYAQLRDIWIAKRADIKNEHGITLCKVFNAPWSWLRYPLFIRDVLEEDYSQSISSEQAHGSTPHTPLSEKEQKDLDKKRMKAELIINSKNHQKEQEFEDLGEAIRTVVRICGWDLLAEDKGNAWDKAVKDVLAGVDIANARAAEGQTQKERGGDVVVENHRKGLALGRLASGLESSESELCESESGLEGPTYSNYCTYIPKA